MMKPTMKVGLIAFIGLCVLFYQYHLSNVVRYDQLASFNGADSAAFISLEDDNGSRKITEDTIKNAVRSVQYIKGLSPDITELIIQELLSQLLIKSTHDNTLTPSSTKSSSLVDLKQVNNTLEPLYIITPTYRRSEQIPELTRMSHTLMLVDNIHWLVIEDSKIPTKQVTQLLERTGLKFEHLIAPMPDKYKLKKGAKPRGVSNRNRGLSWIRANATDGVFYFADDDNTYDIDLFKEIRRTKKVSLFPVGLCTSYGLSSPIIKNGKFIGFYDGWIAGRKFPVDMAGFAVSVKFLHQRPNAIMPYRAGFEEDGFLRSLTPFEPTEAEFFGDNCTRVLAWHTQTKKNNPSLPLNMKIHNNTNLVQLKQQIV
ncbi:hypothetical protein HCN44_008377 [Aphidius gifuensis]|uniref:Galactosylgalactosylxylosylprotein 3-beta-glucuronosyltransferase n=1 Tax=Aphidius gifuensis TaxID=684658 RepID=A0A835CQ12_APHGI|nr:galactosylgalactosylxylosylprotein 3-beta-glucuronosyltransferase P [Aphidius gifuensis]XP_044016780.1 galactosylgalactosylxylosylprotein 3-beta-glucuronosyltransferase P [Aphidius gifuensis]XP_044016781.1 galactosylgalactosylxylosylprotein 3-beta-glucuronosyltransferase P [Aphidius gifuensis]XP_044016782.1 galactosylgalactosylxylosylprotein 3-beta-glucuronosyltransferase P [Aphidius gifuensis]KAF7989703.1 hypothetical protein HCN44_008377 [Aphidius gifuensis]